MPKSGNQRRKEHDERKRAAGLVRVSVWVPETDKARLKKYARQLEKSLVGG